MPNITIAATPEAVAAAQAFAARTGVCIAEAIPVEIDEYCTCVYCEADARDAEAEIWAEGAWLREAESYDRF